MKMMTLMTVVCICLISLFPRVGRTTDLVFDINGTILANTCTIATTSQDMLVELGSHTIAELNSSNTPEAVFTIVLEKCGTSVTGVNLFFTGPAQPGFDILQTQDMIDRNTGVEVTTSDGFSLLLNSGVPIKRTLVPGRINEFSFKAKIRPFTYSKQMMPGPVAVTLNYSLEYL